MAQLPEVLAWVKFERFCLYDDFLGNNQVTKDKKQKNSFKIADVIFWRTRFATIPYSEKDVRESNGTKRCWENFGTV